MPPAVVAARGRFVDDTTIRLFFALGKRYNGPSISRIARMRSKLTLSLALTVVAVAVLGVGCGGSEEPPEKTAARADVPAALNRDLSAAERRVGTEDCEKARETLERLDRRVRDLAPELEAERSSFEKRVGKLGEAVADKCEQEGEQPSETERPIDSKPESAAAPERQTGGSAAQTAPNAGTPSSTGRPTTPSTGGPTTPRNSQTPQSGSYPEPTQEEKDICGENPDPRC
jgi:hypothetical protein